MIIGLGGGASGDVMATGTAQLLFGAADHKRGGLHPQMSLWLYEDDRQWWRTTGGQGDVAWTPRSRDRVVHDALVMLIALTTTPRDPVPTALRGMAPGIEWSSGRVDVSAWRRYDTDLLDTLVVETEPAGKLVLSVLDGSSITDGDLAPLETLGWDVDVLTPSRTLRRGSTDIRQAPPPRSGAPR